MFSLSIFEKDKISKEKMPLTKRHEFYLSLKSRRSLTIFTQCAQESNYATLYIRRNRGTKLVKLSTQFRWHKEAKVSYRENKIVPFPEIRRTRFRISFFHIFRETGKSLTQFDAKCNISESRVRWWRIPSSISSGSHDRYSRWHVASGNPLKPHQ